MSRQIRRAIMVLLLTVFLGSAGIVLTVLGGYRKNSRLYSQVSEEYTSRLSVEDTETGGAAAGKDDRTPGKDAKAAPIRVDFEKLREINADIAGWIYCEGTVIDYPVLQGEDNDFYLSHSYDKKESASGSIFVDANNRQIFEDENTIIYGHHMRDKSMFATLSYWADQEYYREHPTIWLLTPGQDYKIVLFSGYTTYAGSDTYTIFNGSGEELDKYLERCLERSDFTADVVLNGQEKYVVLSTCAYVFDNARYVLHGIVLPADSAGGTALPGA